MNKKKLLTTVLGIAATILPPVIKIVLDAINDEPEVTLKWEEETDRKAEEKK